MAKKESQRYLRELKKVNPDLVTVKRPNEIIERNDGEGNLKLSFKAPEYYERDLYITGKALLSKSQVTKQTTSIDSVSGMTLDLSESETILLTLSGDTVIEDIVNYKNGSIYNIFIKQDEIGGHLLSFNDSLTNLQIDDDVVISGESNSYSELKIICEDDTFYVEYFDGYNDKTNNPFIMTIDTSLGTTGNNVQLPLPETSSDDQLLTYDFIVDWGDGSFDKITSYNQAETYHEYTNSGQTEYQVSIKGICEGISFSKISTERPKLKSIDKWGFTNFITLNGGFVFCSNLTSVNDNNGFWCSNVIDMYGLFYGCSSLSILDVTNWDVTNAANKSYMFNQCTSLSELDFSNWNMSNTTTIKGMFDGYIYDMGIIPIGIENWDTSNINNMYAFLNYNKGITSLDLTNWDVSNVTDFGYMFEQCSNLTELNINTWDTSNGMNFHHMFKHCDSLTYLDISNFNISNATDISYMFSTCTNITNLDVSKWDVSNVTLTDATFWNCASLTSIDVSNWNVGKLIGMDTMFGGCSLLTSIDVSNWNVSNVIDMYGVFSDCTSLTNIDVSNWDISNVNNLINMFNNTPLDTPSYDALLIGWSSLSPDLNNSLTLGANLARYTPGGAAEAGRTLLTDAVIDGGHAWSINDAGPTSV